MTKEKIIEKAIEAGGKRWTKEDLDRVYINPHVIGYTFDYYNTGNICSAKDPDGDSISNAEGRRVKSYKAWIDCKDGTPHTRSNSNDFDGFFQKWFEELTKEEQEQEETETIIGYVLVDAAVTVPAEQMQELEKAFSPEELEHELRILPISADSRFFEEEIWTEMRFTEKPSVKPVFTKEQKENGDWYIRTTGAVAKVKPFGNPAFGDPILENYEYYDL